ncbi:unnamed protein product [Paramecium sonneborni]|uniref:Uncharacterized protein n=1 Tax=Paramecium sonneborni TaxID=65129 RepID=A0A8S1LQX5_9CILI|nr:unnamed protein product [Paramecium sonneborni]
MQNLKAIYKFSYYPQQPLPELHYISAREDEKYFFYQLEGSNYISLNTLLNSYLSQIIRLSIGQCLRLIQFIYQKVIDVYHRENKKLSLITLDNLWIYTESGFNGEIKPQKTMKIIFLNYQDQDVSLEQNLQQLSLVNRQIKKFCRKAEFKIRAKDGKNTSLIQQIINVIDDMFYEVEVCLYENPNQIQQKINEFVNDAQETEYEYLQEDASYIQRRFEQTVGKLNKIFEEDCQNEIQLNKKLLRWQKELHDSFIEYNWERQSYKTSFETILEFEKKLQNIKELNEEQRTKIEHEFCLKLEQQGFFNFNSQRIKQAQQITFQRELKYKLESSKTNSDEIDQLFKDLTEKVKQKQNDIQGFNMQQNVRDYNLKYIKEFYKQNAQNEYKLYDRFYFTINLQEQWKTKIMEEILPNINLNDEKLQNTIIPKFEELLKLNKMGTNNEEPKPKYV